MPHLNYMLLAWGTKCHKIELLQKRAVRLLYFKSPIAHTKLLFKRMRQPILSDLYTCQHHLISNFSLLVQKPGL